ncbi:MAG: hypothetical protein ABL982_17940 [Vicinamibacterales bacterium]
MRSYADASNAWIAEPTAAAFAAAISQAATGDPGRVATARRTAQSFRWEDATRRYFALYDEIHGQTIGQGIPASVSRPDVPAPAPLVLKP